MKVPVSTSRSARCCRRDSLRSLAISTRPMEYIITVTVPIATETLCLRLLVS
ncbi:hypothetical protein D3C80_1703450 [compost metagenome]